MCLTNCNRSSEENIYKSKYIKWEELCVTSMLSLKHSPGSSLLLSRNLTEIMKIFLKQSYILVRTLYILHKTISFVVYSNLTILINAGVFGLLINKNQTKLYLLRKQILTEYFMSKNILKQILHPLEIY